MYTRLSNGRPVTLILSITLASPQLLIVRPSRMDNKYD